MAVEAVAPLWGISRPAQRRRFPNRLQQAVRSGRLTCQCKQFNCLP